jgi:transcriptional regulator
MVESMTITRGAGLLEKQETTAMLYMPPHFRQEDLAKIHADIAATGFAQLITVSGRGPIISHVPLFLKQDGPQDITGHGALIGHLARGNPQWTESDLTKPAVAVFMGPDAYVSPSYYPSKLENPRVVPTWNFSVVHVTGMLEVFEDHDQLIADLTKLTAKHEARVKSGWQVSDAPADFLQRQTRGIVGIRMRITAFDAKSKLSQNRAPADQANVAATLAKSDAPSDRALAAKMRPPE